MPEYSEGSLPSDASGFAQFAKQHSEKHQRLQQQQNAGDSFRGFDGQTSFRTPSAGFLHGDSAPAMFATQVAKEQLHADAQLRKLERRASLGRETVCLHPDLQPPLSVELLCGAVHCCCRL